MSTWMRSATRNRVGHARRASGAAGCRWPARRTAAPGRAGFTLLEVILALSILAGSVAVLGEICRTALRNAQEARDLARAQMLAESKMAEIKSGITTTDSVDDAQFDAATEQFDPSEPGWRYSIKTDATDEPGLLAVRVTVTRDLPEVQHPVKFTLATWLPDPNYTYTPPAPSSGSSTGT
jgi:general secretion pathway protein I